LLLEQAAYKYVQVTMRRVGSQVPVVGRYIYRSCRRKLQNEGQQHCCR